MLPISLLFVLGISWGLRVSLLKILAQSGMPFVHVLFFTTIGVAVLLVLICVLLRRRFPISKRVLPFFLLCGVFGYIVPLFLQLAAAERVPAGTLALIFSTLPIFALLIALIGKTDTVSRTGFVSIALGAISVGVLLGPAAYGQGVGDVGGVLLALCVPITFGLYYNVMSKYWPANFDSLQVATGEVIVAFFLMLPLLFWQDLDLLEPVRGFNGSEWVLALLILFWTLDTYLYFEIVRRRGPVFTSQGNYIMLFSGVLWGFLLFDERPNATFLASLALVTLALFLLTWESLKLKRTR